MTNKVDRISLDIFIDHLQTLQRNIKNFGSFEKYEKLEETDKLVGYFLLTKEDRNKQEWELPNFGYPSNIQYSKAEDGCWILKIPTLFTSNDGIDLEVVIQNK
jgi:hypothetical protein